LKKDEPTRKIFDTINGHLAAQGLIMREGSIVDDLNRGSPSTKNKKRDLEKHQSKKGNDGHFGLKVTLASMLRRA
jgi:IS5 family transposase